jgi:transposase-like protein
MLKLSEIPIERQIKAKYWLEIVTGHKTSGLSIYKYCKERGVNPSTFYYWANYLNGKVPSPSSDSDKKRVATCVQESTKKFVALKLEQELHPKTSPIKEHAGIILYLNNGLRVQLDINFHQTTLLRLIEEFK